jgi:putative transposase
VTSERFWGGVSRNAPTINNRRTAPTINAPTQTIQPNNTNTPKPKSLGRLIGAFKTVSTKQINILRDAPGTPVWQRNYYEHIIRNQDALAKIRKYIVNNPLAWEIDQLHPNHPAKW